MSPRNCLIDFSKIASEHARRVMLASYVLMFATGIGFATVTAVPQQSKHTARKTECVCTDGMDPALTFPKGLCMSQDGNEPSGRKAKEGLKVNVRTLGIDLAKSVFRVHGVDENGKILIARQLRRRQLLPFIVELKPCLVGMEACGGAHHFAREIVKHGHEVRLMSPRFVRPYVKSNKNDARDAEAICEAVTRPSMRFVVVKSQAQQDVLALHRVRALLIRERTALMNQMRGLLAESGIV